MTKARFRQAPSGKELVPWVRWSDSIPLAQGPE
jgi:hypothetical protein